ncbi:hypothetical protein SVAN01_04159 [Stagonosporopsis vannaccii]|nr:hypothetical protein SVAN01_04159 [Stagonosporopsis vannaccii]
MAGWKITPSDSEEHAIEYTSFLDCRKYFAVDDSGSTAGAVLRRERAFVEAFRESHPNTIDAVSLWGSNCDNPTTRFESVQWRSSHGGTYPGEILTNSSALDVMRKSDAWFLLTDGEIYAGDVHRLADLAHDAEVLDVPLVFLITGSRGSSPGTANISVGISFFASAHDTLILFKDVQTGKIYVIAGKGCFAELGGSAAAQDLVSWNELTTFTSEADFFLHCQKSHIKVVKAESRVKSTGAISLGTIWEEQHGGPVRVDLEALLSAGVLADTDAMSLLADEAFDALAIACKTRRRIPELRAFVQAQKIEQVAPKFEDRNGAATVIAAMADATTDEDRRRLQEQLREAHAKNRQDYLKTVAEFAGSPAEQALKQRNQLVDGALRALASIEAASYNADIIGRRSNRARRAEAVHTSSTIDVAQLDLEAPSCKGYCLICCGEEEILAICFKETLPENREDNTSDFALNFPLAAGASKKNVDLISSQNVCFQCALLGQDGMSIYKEKLTAIIPAVQYEGNNKKYINSQLYSALTAHLATGAAGVAQLFMAILQNVMKTKAWAGAGMDTSGISTDGQEEAAQRRKTFQWMLAQLVEKTRTRETFNENGEWVEFPQALAWAAKDFEDNGLASFAVTYPVAGFNSLLALGQHTSAFSDDIVGRLQSAKVLYSIAAKYLAELQVVLQRGSSDTSTSREEWKQKYLAVLYRDFNGPLVPTDHGSDSILSNMSTFNTRLAVCLPDTPATTSIATMHKLQLLLFWLLFSQRGHCTAQTFFTRIIHDCPLAAAVLSPTLAVPPSEHKNTLLSIFATHNAPLIDPTQAAAHHTVIPFANPFGASVLRCGVPSCAHPFIDPSTLHGERIPGAAIEAIRRARAAHLIAVFGIRGRFEASATGLPERTASAAGQPPASVHSNMHITIARAWSEQMPDARRAIVEGGVARLAFVQGVQRKLCVEGRGNVFNAQMEQDVDALLPSFFAVLADALRAAGKSGEDVAVFEHDFTQNNMMEKVVGELMMRDIHGKVS